MLKKNLGHTAICSGRISVDDFCVKGRIIFIKKALILALAASLAFFILGCSKENPYSATVQEQIFDGTFSKKAPSKKQLIKDLSQEEEIIKAIDESGSFNIEDITILLADTENGIYEATVSVGLKNEVYEMSREVFVEYKNYDIGGWKIEDISDIKNIEVNVIGPYPESAAIRYAKMKFNNAKLESHKTNISKKEDVFVFTSTERGKFFDYTVNYTVIYSAANGQWSLLTSSIDGCESKMHSINGLYYFVSGSGWGSGHAIHFNDDNTATMLFEEETTVQDVDTYNTLRTRVLTGTPTFTFDEETFSYRVEFGSYNFTITQNDVKMYNSSLSNIVFFKKRWLREDFYETCVNFIEQDNKRVNITNSTDPSSTITKKDVYGVWGPFYKTPLRYYFHVSDTGVDYDGSSDSTANDVSKADMSKKDYLFYGYDSNEKAYIVYFCTKKYTTTTYYFDTIHTLKFAKTDDGRVWLQSYSYDG